MPHVFRDVDVTAALGAITRLNTKHYQSDFEHDKRIFEEAARSENPEGRRLLWMSRLSGTWCFPERDVFMRDTDVHFTWLNYGDRPQDRILAYAVEITGERDGIIRGDLHELDYKQHAAQVEKCALPTETVTAFMNDGTEKNISYERFKGFRHRDLEPQHHGGIASVRHEPQNGPELAALLQGERDHRSRCARPGSIEKHIKKLAGPEKQSIQKQLAEGAQQAAKDNAARPAPEKTDKARDDGR